MPTCTPSCRHDSAVVIDAYAQRALDNGIAELAITDHVDFAPSAPGYGATTFAERERYVREAADRWADRGRGHPVRRRDHLGQPRGPGRSATTWRATPTTSSSARCTSIATRRTRRRTSPAGSPDAPSPRSWSRTSRRSWPAARSGLFDVMGHIDFVKRFLAPHVTAGGPCRRAGAVRADPARPRRERHGPGAEHERAALAGRGDVPVGGRGRPLPRARRPGVDHRLRRAPRGSPRLGLRRRLPTARDAGFDALTFRRGGASPGGGRHAGDA